MKSTMELNGILFLLLTEPADGNVGANREVCRMVRNAGTVPVTHFTVIRNTKQGIREQLETYLKEGVDHILALRGGFSERRNLNRRRF